MWWIVFTIFIQYQGRPPFIEFADAVKSMLMNYEIYSIRIVLSYEKKRAKSPMLFIWQHYLFGKNGIS